ncbi:MAG TPA: TonB-dependent receptor [Chlorobiota bacterium]|nr:TonB-dependent receptor [Chlorobiota bacterium]
MTRFVFLLTLLFGLGFAKQQASPFAPSPVDTAGRTQVVRGTVIDAISNAPIPGARVTVMIDGKGPKGAIVQRDGSFKIAGIDLGRHTISIASIGYDPYVNDNVLVTSGKEVVLTITLNEAFSQTADVEVVYERAKDVGTTNNEYATVSGRAFNLEDTKRYAGALGDPSRMAQNFAGVVGANDSRNDIVVRGNSPAGMLWMMEGMIIPNPNHFGSLGSTGGPVSMLNNNVLDKSDFMTSAFPAMYGNAISGAFDLQMRKGNTDRHEFVGQIGFNGFEFGAEGPTWEGSSYLVNYRYSTLGIFKALGINFGSGSAVPDYQDANFKVVTKLDDASSLTLFGTGGASDVTFLGNEADTNEVDLYGDPDRNIAVDYKTGWAGLAYDRTLDENTYLKVLLGVAGTSERYDGDSIDPVTRLSYRDETQSLSTLRLSAAGSIRHKLSNTSSIVGGFFVDRTTYDLYRRDNIDQPDDRTFVDSESSSTLGQAYAQYKLRVTEDLTMNAGLHAQYLTIGDAVAVEPRIGISYILAPSLSVNVGYGLHSQAQNIYTYNVRSADGRSENLNLGFTRSHHVVAGTDWFPLSDLRLRVEAYYQSLFDVPVERTPSSFSAINTGNDFAPSNRADLISNGTGRNVGAEFTLEKFFGDGYYFLVTTSLFDSKYTGSDGVERNTAFNTRYVVNILGGKEFSIGDDDVLALNIKLSTTGGRYLTPIDLVASAAAGRTIFDESRAYSEQQTPYFRLDVRIAYRMEFAGATMEFSVDLQNATNNKNVFVQSFNRRTGGLTTEYQQGFFPVPTFRLTF